jgi:hypothetical protein
VYVRSDTGEYWVSNGTSWIGPYLNITSAERTKLANLGNLSTKNANSVDLPVAITDATPTTNSTSGALRVSGGISTQNNIHAGGYLSAGNTAKLRSGAGSNTIFLGSDSSSASANCLAIGAGAANSVTTGANWLAEGVFAGYNNTTGSDWIAQGYFSAVNNTTGSRWIAQGIYAGYSNTTGNNWIAQGFFAGVSNTVGSDWIAQGVSAGHSNGNGSNWIAQGTFAGYSNLTGSNWIAQGYYAGINNTGSNWVAQGFEAGFTETRSFSYHVGVYRDKSLLVGLFNTDCLYIGNVNTNPTPTAAAHLAASNTNRASLRLDPGVAPTTPNDGDIWYDGTNLKMRIAGVTRNFTLV